MANPNHEVLFTRYKPLDYSNNVYDANNPDGQFLCSLFGGRKFTFSNWDAEYPTANGPCQGKRRTLENAQEILQSPFEKVIARICAWFLTIVTLGIIFVVKKNNYLKQDWIKVTKHNARFIELGDAIKDNKGAITVIGHIRYESQPAYSAYQKLGNPSIAYDTDNAYYNRNTFEDLVKGKTIEVLPHNHVSGWAQRHYSEDSIFISRRLAHRDGTYTLD